VLESVFVGKQMTDEFEPVVLPAGTKVYVLDHWTGHCAHKYGKQITVTGTGFVECEQYPGCFRGTVLLGRGRRGAGGLHDGAKGVALGAPTRRSEMGWNSTVVVMNDALGYIEEDPEFGTKLARAISKLTVQKPVNIAARGRRVVRTSTPPWRWRPITWTTWSPSTSAATRLSS